MTISCLNVESCFHSEQKALLTSIIEGCHWLLALRAMAEVFLLLAFSKFVYYFFYRLESCTVKNNTFEKIVKKAMSWGFPGDAVVENLPANAGDTGSSPGLGRSHMPRS